MAKDPLTRAQNTRDVLDKLALGYGATKIAAELGLSIDVVREITREAAAQLQKDNAEHVSEAFMQQDEAIMYLYRRCIEEIQASSVFPEKAIVCAIKLMERRARLLGLDKAGPQAGRGGGGFSWLRGNESQSELAAMAKELGIAVPQPFATNA